MTYWPRTSLTLTRKYSCCYARLAKLRVAFDSVDLAFPDHQITSNDHKTMANKQNNDWKRCSCEYMMFALMESGDERGDLTRRRTHK